MQALILAGGKGTRLRPLTVFTPKPLLPICNRSLIHYQVEMLKRAGITDVVLSLSYQPNKIEQQLGDGSSLGVHIRCVAEHQPMGTSGALRFAESILSERAVVLNGDILTDLDLKVAIREHENRQSAATIVTALVDDPSEFGVIETDNENRITRFIEKPAAGETESKYVNAGTYILEPGVLESIPPSRASSFEYDLFPQLISEHAEIYSHNPVKTYWRDIGTLEGYNQANMDLLQNKVGRIHVKNRIAEAGIRDGAEIDDISMIGESCTLKQGARIVNSILGAGCFVEEKAVVENSILWPHTRVGANAVVSGAILGRGCHAGRFTTISEGTILGDKSIIADHSRTGVA